MTSQIDTRAELPCQSALAAQRFADEWIAAWNAHDLPRILSHYADDFEMRSPLIVERMGVASGALQGKQTVATYWAKGLAASLPLRFELIEVFRGIDSIAIVYRSVTRARRVVEYLHFQRDGLIDLAAGIYGEPTSSGA